MPRALLSASFALLVACGPDTAERGDFYSSQPFYSPVAPVTVAEREPDAPASAEPSPGSTTDSSSGTSSPDAGSAPSVNQAERVWKAQDKVWLTGQRLKEDYGMPAVNWLKVARSLAGSTVTSGLVTEQPDGTYRYATGGTTLRIATRNGWRGELRIDNLVGDLGAKDFPRAREGVDVSWLYSDGASLRCLLEQEVARFAGWTLDEAGETVRVSVTYRAHVSVVSGPDASGNWASMSSIDSVASGEVTWPGDRTVRYLTEEYFWLCVGACTGGSGKSSFRDHQTEVEFHDGGQRWSLDYDDGYDRSSETGLTSQLWRGTIAGPMQGRLVARPVNSVYSLDVEIGADRYSAGAATHLLQ